MRRINPRRVKAVKISRTWSVLRKGEVFHIGMNDKRLSNRSFEDIRIATGFVELFKVMNSTKADALKLLKTTPAITYFMSGVHQEQVIEGLYSRDMNVGTNARIIKLKQRISLLKRMGKDKNYHGRIFVDSGAFGEIEFRQKNGQDFGDKEWKEIFDVYDKIVPLFPKGRVYIVAPDRIYFEGQTRSAEADTLARIKKYGKRVKALYDKGAKVIAAVQNSDWNVGYKRLKKVMVSIGVPNFVVGFPVTVRNPIPLKEKKRMLDEVLRLNTDIVDIHLLGISANTNIFQKNYIPVLETYAERVRVCTDAQRFGNIFRRAKRTYFGVLADVAPGTALKDKFKKMVPRQLYPWVQSQIDNNLNFLNPPNRFDTWDKYAIAVLLYTKPSKTIFDKDIRNTIIKELQQTYPKVVGFIGQKVLKKGSNLEKFIRLDQDDFKNNFCSLMQFMTFAERQYIRKNTSVNNEKYWNIVFKANQAMIENGSYSWDSIIEPSNGVIAEPILLGFALQDIRNRKGSQRQLTLGDFATLYAISLLPNEALGLSDDPSQIIANPSTMFMP